jgi:hypothetical protein
MRLMGFSIYRHTFLSNRHPRESGGPLIDLLHNRTVIARFMRAIHGKQECLTIKYGHLKK